MFNRKSLIIFLAVLSVLALTMGPSPLVSAKIKPLVFAGNRNFPPYSFSSGENASGFCVDLVKILSATINKNISIELMDSEKCVKELLDGKVDGIIGIPKENDPDLNIAYSSPISKIEFAIFVDANNTYVSSLKSLEGKVVAMVKGCMAAPLISSDDRIQVILTETLTEALEKLGNREVTAVLAEKNVALYHIRMGNYKGFKIVGDPVGPIMDYCLAVRKDNFEILKDIDRGISILKENDTLRKLERKWFGLRLAGPFPWKMVILMTSGITLLMLILAGILWVISLNATVRAKTRQIQLMSQRMVEKDKLAVLGKLAGQIAHELRTPLSIINNSVYLLRKEGAENREIFEKRLRILQEKIKLSSNILESILSYSRVKAEVARTVSMKECIEEVMKDVETPPGIAKEVVFEKASSLVVFMDFHQLYSVIRNIVLNAFQAMGSEGSLMIHAAPSEDTTSVIVRICDSGPGIAEAARKKIFNLFYSTKITGTGLGLPISKSIIEANGGKLFLEETSGKGSCFIIQLPSTKMGKNA